MLIRSTVDRGPARRGRPTKFVKFYFLIRYILHSNRSVVYGRHFHIWNSWGGCRVPSRMPPMPGEIKGSFVFHLGCDLSPEFRG